MNKKLEEIRREQQNYQDEIEKRELAAKGIVSGTAATALGAGLYKISKDLKKKLKSGNFKIIRGNEDVIVKQLIDTNRAGKVLMGVGAPIAGISAYKHFKYKKKDKEDDNKA